MYKKRLLLAILIAITLVPTAIYGVFYTSGNYGACSYGYGCANGTASTQEIIRFHIQDTTGWILIFVSIAIAAAMLGLFKGVG